MSTVEDTPHAVGLDAPASAVEMLTLLRREGYSIEDAPEEPAELIARLTSDSHPTFGMAASARAARRLFT